MTMPDASSASLIPDHDDSGTYLNHDKDFAPPPKKLKGEEEEDNTPVVPMSQDSGEEEVPKSQDSPYIWAGYAVDSDLEEEKEAPPYTEKEARDAFDLWRQLFLVKEYADQSEYEKRFKFFKDSLHRRVSRCWRSNAMNMIDLADRSPQEIRAAEEEARHAFDLWRQMFLLKEYADQSEYEKRFKFFKDSLYRKVTPSWERFAANLMSLADQSPQEARRFSQYCSITINQILDGYEDFKVYMSS